LLLEINSFLYNHDVLHQLAIAALSSYGTAPGPVFKGLPSAQRPVGKRRRRKKKR
jgi:hypothetical protein